MARLKISILIMTYNQRPYISRCLQSVMSQQVEADLEVLVGDDCSDDGTSDIVAEFASSHPGIITHLRHSSRVGASFNTRLLLARAGGDYIARLDGDDYWLKDKLSTQISFLENNLDCLAVYTNARIVREDDLPLGVFNDVGDARISLPQLLRNGNYLNNSSILFRAELKHDWLKLTGPVLDYRVHLLHASKGWLGHIGEPLTVYRVGSPGSLATYDSDNVRRLYWDAILSVPRDRVTSHDFALGVADFYRRVLFRSTRTRRAALAVEWWPQVRQASPYGVCRTSWLVLRACLRIAWRRFLDLANTGAGGRRPRVLYRR